MLTSRSSSGPGVFIQSEKYLFHLSTGWHHLGFPAILPPLQSLYPVSASISFTLLPNVMNQNCVFLSFSPSQFSNIIALSWSVERVCSLLPALPVWMNAKLHGGSPASSRQSDRTLWQTASAIADRYRETEY